jgi:hypothetical protein
MPKRLHLRDLSPEEEVEVRQLATSRRAAARLVQRAQVTKLPVAAAGRQVGYSNDASRHLWGAALQCSRGKRISG